MRTATVLALVGLACAACDPRVMRAEQAARQNLVDPSSARFADVRVASDGQTVCGSINGKNRMGAYAGNQIFVVEKDGTSRVMADVGEAAHDYISGEGIGDSYYFKQRFETLDNACAARKLWETKCVPSVDTSKDQEHKICDAWNDGRPDDLKLRLAAD